MPKGQQKGNREAKKPKKAAAPAPIPVVPAPLKPAQNIGLPRWPKK
jgi:hypothetical protein